MVKYLGIEWEVLDVTDVYQNGERYYRLYDPLTCTVINNVPSSHLDQDDENEPV